MRFYGTRITLRLHRFELVAFGFALGGLTVALFVGSVWVASLQPALECFTFIDSVSADCQVALDRYSEATGWLAGLLFAPLTIVVFAVGLFLGAPVVARELERGTVRLAWALSPSRWRWYAARLVPILVVIVVLTFLAGVAMDQYYAASLPGADLSRSFEGYGIRGGLLAARAIFVFALAVVAGAFLGRTLPTVLVAALLATIALTAGLYLHDRILQGEVVVVPTDPTGSGQGGAQPGDRFFDQKFVLPDGTLVGYEYFFEGGQGDAFDEFGNPKYEQVDLVIPGERYRSVEARELAALLGGSVVALVIAGFVVARRRPG